MSINREYKDRLFCLLFGEEKYKENTLALYNAVNGTNYENVNDIKIFTIDDVIYIDMKNDVALIFDSYLSLWEHQSSPNPNMPLRGLMYFGKLYDKYIEENKLNIYGSTLVRIPAPRYIIFYNGEKNAPAVEKLKLSDAFMGKAEGNEYEWTATMYNLNPGFNEELLEKCKPLKEYMQLVGRIRDYTKQEMPIEVAVDKAVDYCIDNNILSAVLLSHKAEVKDMCITEYNEEVFLNGIRNESETKGRFELLFEDVRDGFRTEDQAAQKANVSLEVFQEKYKKWKGGK